MFSQSADFSQSSNGDYTFLHNNSQNSSQFELDGTLNKNQNIVGIGELGTINEENPLSPMKINYNSDSKKSLINNQNLSKTSKYSFGAINNNNNSINIVEESSNNANNIELKQSQKNINPNNNKENINNNILTNKNKENNNNFFQLNIDSYKCQLSQQIDQVEKIASQSMNSIENNNNRNKLNENKGNTNINVNISNAALNNSISEEELLEHQRFNKYCSDLIDNAMNKNLDYIDNIKNNFVNSLDIYKIKFKTNAEIIKKLILLYSDDIFQKEKNKIIISNLTDQLLTHINSFFQEMNKFNNINFNSTNITNNNGNENSY